MYTYVYICIPNPPLPITQLSSKPEVHNDNNSYGIETGSPYPKASFNSRIKVTNAWCCLCFSRISSCLFSSAATASAAAVSSARLLASSTSARAAACSCSCICRCRFLSSLSACSLKDCSTAICISSDSSSSSFLTSG